MNKKDVFYLLIFLIFWLIFFRKIFFQGMVPAPGNLLVWFFSPWKEEQWPQYPGGVYKQGLFGFDTIRQIYPWRSFSTEQLLEFQWPLWNPYQFAGVPHLANFQTAIFYPFNLIYLIIPQIYAWTILLISQPLLAGIFMYLLVKKLGVSRLGSFFAAFSYAFSLTMSVWLIWNIHAAQFAYLPLIFYLIEKYKDREKINYLFWLIIVLVLTFLAGHPQIFIFIFSFAGIYFLYRLKKIKIYFFISLWVLALTAVAWLPLLEYYRLASREIPSSEFNYERTLMPWANLLTLIAPDFLGNPTTANHFGGIDYTEGAVYTGLIALIFSLIAVRDYKNKKKIFFIIAIIAVFALCLDWFLPKIFHDLRIPVLGSSAATRVLFLVTFCLGVLAGFGVDDFLKKKKFPKIVFLPGLILIFTLILLYSAPKIFSSQPWLENLRVMKRNLVLPSLIFVGALIILELVFRFKKFKKLTYFLVLFMAVDLFYVANKVLPFTYRELVFPGHPLMEFLKKNSQYYRFAGSQASNIESNFAAYYRIFSTEGYDTLYPRYYGELVWAADSGEYKEDISRSTVVFPVNKNETRYRLEDLLGVRFVLNKDDNYRSEWDHDEILFPKERYRLAWQRKNWKVYENLKVLPRAFLAGNFLTVNDKKEAIATIYRKDFTPAETIILEKEPSLKLRLDSGNGGQADIISYLPNKVELETQADGNKILFLSDTYYPGWKAYVDGEESEVYKADYAFRAVFVPAGKHKIIFSYEPISFKIGLLISLGSLFSTIIYLLWLGYKSKKCSGPSAGGP